MSFQMIGVEMWIIMVVTNEMEMICAALVGCMAQRSYVGVLHVMTLKSKD